MDRDIIVIGVGYGPIEAIPLYHVALGGTVARLLAKTSRSLDLDCSWMELCWIDRVASIGLGVKMPIEYIMDFIYRWRVNAVLIDGIEPLSLDGTKYLMAAIRNRGKILIVRSQGLDCNYVNAIYEADYILYDYIAPISKHYAIAKRQVECLEKMASMHDDIEVLSYIPDAKHEYLIPLVETLASINPSIPLHVIVKDYSGGRGIRDLQATLSSRIEYLYIHAGEYSSIDTYCPKCKAPVASREPSVLKAVNVREGRCPICGNSIPFKRIINNRTPEYIIRVTGGETKWHHPLRRVWVDYNY